MSGAVHQQNGIAVESRWWTWGGLVKFGLVWEKMGHTGGKLDSLSWTIHQEALCAKVSGMEHVMAIVTKTVNFVSSPGSNHWHFRELWEEGDVHDDVPYPMDVGYLSQGGTCCKDFMIPALNITCFMESKQKVIPKLEDEKWLSIYLCQTLWNTLMPWM